MLHFNSDLAEFPLRQQSPFPESHATAVLKTITAEDFRPFLFFFCCSFYQQQGCLRPSRDNPGSEQSISCAWLSPSPRHGGGTQCFGASSSVTMFFSSTKQSVQLEQSLLLPSLPTFN